MMEADAGSTIERPAPVDQGVGIRPAQGAPDGGRPFGDAPGASDEADLVRRLKAGEDAAFEELVRSLTPRLLAVARRVARTEADAEDAVQEAFLSAFGAIEGFDGRSTLGTWLHRIVVNAALMRARREATRRAVSLDSLLPVFEGGHHRDAPAPWRSVTGEEGPGIEHREAVLEALARLPEEFREVVLLRDVEGMESRAVSVALGISDALVRQRLHRGRQAMMRLLEPVMRADRAGDGERGPEVLR